MGDVSVPDNWLIIIAKNITVDQPALWHLLISLDNPLLRRLMKQQEAEAGAKVAHLIDTTR